MGSCYSKPPGRTLVNKKSDFVSKIKEIKSESAQITKPPKNVTRCHNGSSSAPKNDNMVIMTMAASDGIQGGDSGGCSKHHDRGHSGGHGGCGGGGCGGHNGGGHGGRTQWRRVWRRWWWWWRWLWRRWSRHGCMCMLLGAAAPT
ncbi:hypothetical protein QL285_062605 [Trifolium repens]|nr:hypothetical protein QL285_062605 [Trifolium repens]